MTTFLIVAVVLLVVALAGGALFVSRLSPADGEDTDDSSEAKGVFDFQVKTKAYFFTPAENKFYGELSAVAGELGLLVFPKVGLNDLFDAKPGAKKGQYGRYSQMHVDFLLVTKKDYRPVAGLELDGSSHQGQRQQARDQNKNAVFKAAQLPLLRFLNYATITSAELRQKLEDGVALPAGVA